MPPYTGLVLCLIGLSASARLAKSRTPNYCCRRFELWPGEINASGNSQYLANWYTPSHIVNGFLFSGAPRLSDPV
ncbi:hypothetical protein C4E04_01280 [Microvirga sp. 17 mud 1-3]|nr:hypothetical protein C4E04_01280 [Microvirga sp. 17 mud 1-3]